MSFSHSTSAIQPQIMAEVAYQFDMAGTSAEEWVEVLEFVQDADFTVVEDPALPILTLDDQMEALVFLLWLHVKGIQANMTFT